MKLNKELWLYHYLPTIILLSLPFWAFIYLFWEGFDSNKTLFSNDGPLGIQASDWMQQGYYPGGALWQDTHWLGLSNGTVPVSFTSIIYWLFNNPLFLIPTLIICAIVIAYQCYIIIKESPNENKKVNDWIHIIEPAQNHRAKCHFLRCFSICISWRFAWLMLTDPTKTYLNPLEAICWLGYFMLVLPLWFGYEIETREFFKQNKI